MKKRALKKLFSRRKRVQASRDNRGFTLLELIIAMAIFAVITIPIMNMFSKSAELNGKARRVQNTNDAASSIAETIKAADLEKDFSLTGKNDSKTFDDTAASNLAAIFGASGAIGTPTIDDKGKLSLQLKDVPSGGRKFDAAVTLDPNSSEYFSDRNNEKVTTGQNVTQYYAESKGAGTTPYDKAWSNVRLSPEDVVNSHSRTIEINFDVSPQNGKQVVKAEVNYTYSFYFTHYEYDDVTKTTYSTTEYRSSTLLVHTANILTYDNNDGKDHPISFFLFFNPDYTSTGSLKDQITINNQKNLTGGVYVIKQKEEGLTHSRENSYSAVIELKENHLSSKDMNLSIGTNINISHVDDTYGKKLSGNFLVKNKISNSVIRTMEPEGNYIASSDYDRVYAYTVKVYDPTGEEHPDTETPVYEISGVRLR